MSPLTDADQAREEQAKEGYMDAATTVRYLNHLGVRYQKRLRTLAAASSITSAAVFVDLAASGPVWAATVLAAVTAVLTATGLYLGKDTKWLDQAAAWNERSHAWRAAWQDSMSGDPVTPEALATLRKADVPLNRDLAKVPQDKDLQRGFQRDVLRAEGYI